MRLTVLAAALLTAMASARITPEQALATKLSQNDKRYITFKLAMDIMLKRGLKTIVETGTARDGDSNCGGDGCSTVVLSRFAEGNPGFTVESVDISPDAVRRSAEAFSAFNCTRVVESDSLQFLRDYGRPIDFLYLDSFDFDHNDPRPSQEHHLKEIIAAYGKLHDDSVVMVDDCGLSHGGKCTLVELFLQELGWRTLVKGYQVLMVTSKDVVL